MSTPVPAPTPSLWARIIAWFQANPTGAGLAALAVVVIILAIVL